MTDSPSRPVVLVTGGSRGIGAATCRRVAAAGWDIAVGYLRDASAAATVVEDCESLGVRAVAVQGDTGVEADVTSMFAAVDDAFGRLDALVNNAAVLYPLERLEHVDSERLRRTFDVNVFGPVWCAQHAITRCSTRHGGAGGVIVNVSSGAARTGSPGAYVDYAASKGAIDTLTVGLAGELADDGIRVVGVRPGFIDTDIHASIGEPDRLEPLIPTVPLRRAGRADEVAAVIVFALSDEASYVTGTTIDVTGGR